MAPSSASNLLSPPPRETQEQHRDTQEQHHEHLSLTKEQDEMAAKNNCIFQYNALADAPAASAAVAEHFDIVAQADHASMKLKANFDEAATARLMDTASVVTARLEAATSWTPKRWAESVSMAATPFLLSGLGGLAIWRMTGQRAPKMPSARLGAKPIRVPYALRAKSIHAKSIHRKL